MLELAVAGERAFCIDPIERDLPGPGYSLHVIRALRKRHPQAQFCFIIGADNLSDMENWYRPADIVAEIPIVAGARPGYSAERPTWTGSRAVEFVSTDLTDVSSSEIRRRVQSGADRDELSAWVPESVADYIIREGLYR